MSSLHLLVSMTAAPPARFVMYVFVALVLAAWIIHAAAEQNRSEEGEDVDAAGTGLRRLFVVGHRKDYTRLGWRLLLVARSCEAAAAIVALSLFIRVAIRA